MCGIVGYIGYDQAAPFLLKGLEKLEYRGYDSAGIAICFNDSLKVIKAQGRLNVLSDMTSEGLWFPGHVGIGHTRWATHGKPSIVNSHPLVSESGKFAVVHNGIIENYCELKDELTENGVTFASETDTEAIVQLVDHFYTGDFLDAVIKATKRLQGSYAFSVVCEDCPDQIIAVKKDNPLIIGVGENESFIASDVTAIISRTRNIIRLEDNQIAVVKRDKIDIYNAHGEPVDNTPFYVNWDVCAAEKCGYDHFMFKEIMEQPKAVKDTINPRVRDGRIIFDEVAFSAGDLEKISKICIVACGSAYHVGCVAKYVFEKMLRKPVEVEVASEFRYRSPIIDENVLVIAISQSGETADTLAAVRESKRLGAKVLSIVNVVGSSIANESDYVIYTWAGPEIAVATTKAYSTQLSVVYMLAIHMADVLGKIAPQEYNYFVSELLALPEKIEKILSSHDDIKYFATKFFRNTDVFFIGRNLDYAVCLEGSLKLKEISYIHSEAYAAGELKHGTISLIEDGTLVVALVTHGVLVDKMVSNIKEVKARGASILALAEEGNSSIGKISDYEFYLPKTCEIMMPSLAVIPLQIFSYYVASLKECDVDKPRNLAKSVTVE